MRVLILTRTHPRRDSGPFAKRLHERISELSELGHDVLVLTRWTDRYVDFDLPKRIEVRSPFRSFRTWEWSRALPVVIQWQPEIVHIVDPALGMAERAISAELAALPVFEVLRSGSGGRFSFQGTVVSFSDQGWRSASDRQHAEKVWKAAGAISAEYDWLKAEAVERTLNKWDGAHDRNLLFLLVGGPHERHNFLPSLDAALSFMQEKEGFELTVNCDRASLSQADRRKLGQWERRISKDGNSCVGNRLHLVPLGRSLGAVDGAILAGLNNANVYDWLDRLPYPLAITESQAARGSILKGAIPTTDLRIAAEVADVAWMEQSLAFLNDRARLRKTWDQIEDGGLEVGRDVAANRMSRLYATTIS